MPKKRAKADRSTRPMLQKPTKIRKGRAANANISSSVGNLIGIPQSLKKGEARIGPDGSVPSLGNQFSETKKSLDDRLQLLLWRVRRTPKKQTKKSQCQQFDRLSLRSRQMLEKKRKEGKRKPPMPTFCSVGVSIGLTKKEKKNLQGEVKPMVPSHYDSNDKKQKQRRGNTVGSFV